jgi:hypothetical protein
MIDVYFENIYEQIQSYVEQAKRDIKLCVAWFTDSDLYRAILNAKRNGVTVSVIIANHEINHNNGVDFKELLLLNGTVRYIGENSRDSSAKLMHHKFCIIDGEILITGSYNWTYKARRNDENILIIKDEPHILTQFEEKFDDIMPTYQFAIKNDQVLLFPIQSIVEKWDDLPISNKKNKPILDIGNISNKF